MKIRYLLVLIYERLHWLCFYLPVFLTKQVNKLVRTKIRLQVSRCVLLFYFLKTLTSSYILYVRE